MHTQGSHTRISIAASYSRVAAGRRSVVEVETGSYIALRTCQHLGLVDISWMVGLGMRRAEYQWYRYRVSRVNSKGTELPVTYVRSLKFLSCSLLPY
jgi:hypothetical protein